MWTGAAAKAGAEAVDRSSSLQQKQRPSKGAAAVGRSSSCWEEQSGGGGRHYNISECGCCYSPKNESGSLERRAGGRALTLAMRRGSEVSDGLRSPEPAIQELEISWVSEEREELEEEEYGKTLETEPEPPLPETHWSRWKKEYLNRFIIYM